MNTYRDRRERRAVADLAEHVDWWSRAMIRCLNRGHGGEAPLAREVKDVSGLLEEPRAWIVCLDADVVYVLSVSRSGDESVGYARRLADVDADAWHWAGKSLAIWQINARELVRWGEADVSVWAVVGERGLVCLASTGSGDRAPDWRQVRDALRDHGI